MRRNLMKESVEKTTRMVVSSCFGDIIVLLPPMLIGI
jgi:hypothetical protein